MKKSEMKPMEKMFMNIKTGSIDTYLRWFYEDENGKMVNAVDLGEVVEVKFDCENDQWVEVMR